MTCPVMCIFVTIPPQKKNVKNIMTTDKHGRHYTTEILLNLFYHLLTYVSYIFKQTWYLLGDG